MSKCAGPAQAWSADSGRAVGTLGQPAGCLSFTPPDAGCQQLKCSVPKRHGTRRVSPDATPFLSLSLLPAPCSPPEKPVFLCVGAPGSSGAWILVPAGEGE